MLEKYKKYCQLLGVGTSASAKEVKQKFHEKIKKYHPDSNSTAGNKEYSQLLIEAYSALKNGVPPWLKEAEERESYIKARQRSHKANTDTKKHGYQAATRIFSGVSARISQHEKFRNFFNDLGEEVYPQDEETSVWQYTPQNRSFSSDNDVSDNNTSDNDTSTTNDIIEDYQDTNKSISWERAETNLQNVVNSFDNRGNRFQKRWAQDFIGNLTQVQVLYRDLCNFDPYCSYKSLERIRQINELIREIRQAF